MSGCPTCGDSPCPDCSDAVPADPLITEPRSCGHKFVLAATCDECARSLQAKCRHDATAFLGWRSGVPLRECLRCKAVVRP